MRKVTSLKIVFWSALTVFITLYLNIGWALGTYWNSIFDKPAETFWQKFWNAGTFNLLAVPTAPLLWNQIFSMLAWPISVLFVAALWIFQGVYYLLWFIFAGGLAKLVGLG